VCVGVTAGVAVTEGVTVGVTVGVFVGVGVGSGQSAVSMISPLSLILNLIVVLPGLVSPASYHKSPPAHGVANDEFS